MERWWISTAAGRILPPSSSGAWAIPRAALRRTHCGCSGLCAFLPSWVLQLSRRRRRPSSAARRWLSAFRRSGCARSSRRPCSLPARNWWDRWPPGDCSDPMAFWRRGRLPGLPRFPQSPRCALRRSSKSTPRRIFRRCGCHGESSRTPRRFRRWSVPGIAWPGSA